MKFLRSTLFATATVLVAAACGDKVTVAGPTTATPKVNSVSVSPATATLNVGDKITMTAAVNADAGVATTVTWSSSGAAATVDAGGVVTAVSASPGIAICATSTVNTSVKGCGSVVIAAVAPAIPASVSIASITVAGNLNAPVNPAAVAGQIDITLNVNPGNQTINKVVMLVGAVRTDSQLFSAAQAAALRSAADLSLAEQTTFPQVIFSVNTAQFNATTGIPTWLNGPNAVSALVYTKQGGTASAATASAATSLTFVNANTWIVGATPSGASAASSTGYAWRAGSIAVTALPVIYNGLSVSLTAPNSVTFGAFCDNTIGNRTIALVAPVAPSSAWTATFNAATTSAASATNFRNYEMNPGCVVNGEGFTLTAIDNLGNQLFGGVAPANNAAVRLRMDNVAPAAPTFVANPNGRQNFWINDAVSFTTIQSGTNLDGWLTAATVDNGIGTVTYSVKTGDNAAGTTDVATAGAAATSAAAIAASAANVSQCAVSYAADKLGNTTANPAAATACALAGGARQISFGVDRAAPTIAFSAGLASNARINTATVAAEFQVTVLDTGAVGNSGMNSVASVNGTVSIRNASGASPVCFIGAVVSGVCTAVSVNAAPAFPLVPTTTVAASATVGYYTYTAASRDAAGNSSANVTRVVAFDPAANIPALTTALYNTPLSGSATFNANASDNFDLRDVTYFLTYAGGLAGPIVYPAVVLNTFNVAPLVNNNVPAGITIANFVRQVENVTSGPAGPLAVGGAFKPTGITGTARDQANNSTAAIPTAIAGASVTTGTSYLASAAPQLASAWAVTAPSAATNISTGAGPAAAVNPLSVTLTTVVNGPTATFNAPFARVDFYAVVAGQLVQIGTTSAFTTTDDGSAQGRKHTYAITWTPGASWGLGAQAIYAIGVNAAGDALVTPVNGTITTTNP